MQLDWMENSPLGNGVIRLRKKIILSGIIGLVLLIIMGCGTTGNSKSTNSEIADEIREKAIALVELFDSSMQENGFSISEEELIAEMNSYQQLLLEKDEIIEEMTLDFLQVLEEWKKNGVQMDDMGYLYMSSYKMYEYLEALKGRDTLTSDEKYLDSIIHSLYFHSLEYQSRVEDGALSSFMFVGVHDEENEAQAAERLKEMEEIKTKSTENLLKDYDKLYVEFNQILTHSSTRQENDDKAELSETTGYFPIEESATDKNITIVLESITISESTHMQFKAAISQADMRIENIGYLLENIELYHNGIPVPRISGGSGYADNLEGNWTFIFDAIAEPKGKYKVLVHNVYATKKDELIKFNIGATIPILDSSVTLEKVIPGDDSGTVFAVFEILNQAYTSDKNFEGPREVKLIYNDQVFEQSRLRIGTNQGNITEKEMKATFNLGHYKNAILEADESDVEVKFEEIMLLETGKWVFEFEIE